MWSGVFEFVVMQLLIIVLEQDQKMTRLVVERRSQTEGPEYEKEFL